MSAHHNYCLIAYPTVPHKACLRREGLQLDRYSSEINFRLVFAAVSDTHKVPLTNQISRSLGWNLMSDNRLRPDMLQNLPHTYIGQVKKWEITFVPASIWPDDASTQTHADNVQISRPYGKEVLSICGIHVAFLQDLLRCFSSSFLDLLKGQPLTFICCMLGFHLCISSTLTNRRS